MAAPARREKLHSLQALRAVAALAVLVFHVCNDAKMGTHAGPLAMQALKVAADCAVDLFFVLSGFIMVYTQGHAQRSAGDFARQRIARIVPLYWTTTFAFTAFVLVAEPTAPGLSGAVQHLGAAKNYIGSSLLFVSHLLGYKFPVVLPGWSLEYEILFYALFASAILVSRRHTVAICTALLAALTLSGMLRPICIEFAAGALVGQLWFRGIYRQFAAAALLVAPAVVAAGLSGGWYWRAHNDDWLRLLFCGTPMLAVFLVALCVEARRRPVFALLGDCSYAIYVSHCGWLAVYVRYVLPKLPQWQGLALSAGLAWCLAGGVLLHFLVEKRFDRWLRARRTVRAQTATTRAATA